MRLLLLMNYGEVGSECAPMTEWRPTSWLTSTSSTR